MAGIGFNLRRILDEDTYLGTLRTYLYAAILSSGPWLISVLALALLGVVSSAYLPQEDRALFSGTLLYVFALSLITTGLLQMPVTRFIADKHYLREFERIGPGFVTVTAAVSCLQFLTALAFFGGAGLSMFYLVSAAALYVIVSGLWMTMLFVSAAKGYRTIVAAFAAGYTVSFVLSASLGSRFGVNGHLAGFTAGQALTLGLLVGRVLWEFQPSSSLRIEWLGHLRKYPSLLAIGILYNAAIWADKATFWLSPDAVVIRPVLRVYPVYDTAMFLAYLLMVPALAIFLVHIETDFYQAYRRFYGAIGGKGSFDQVVQAKQEMVRSLNRSLLTLAKLQAPIAILALILAPALLRELQLPLSGLHIFRLASLATSSQIFVLITLLILLYLDLRGSALILCSVFLVANGAFTLVTLHLGYAYYGFGYLYAVLLALACGLFLLRRGLDQLEYLTFSRQPM